MRVRRRELIGQLDAEAESAGEGEHAGHALHSRVVDLANARTIDGPPRDADLMNVRMREQKRVHDAV